jgi:MYXO-CTERM domain-containing protein
VRADAQGSGPIALTTTVDVPREERRPWIGKLWARERVGDLLETMALGGMRDDLRRETIELALAYNIVTPYTSFLAIPASEVLTADAAATLAEARRRKAAVMAQNPDAIALGGGQAAEAPAPPGEERPMMLPAPMAAEPSPPPPAPPPSMDSFHGRGCAGCTVGGDETPWHGAALAAIGIAIIALRRRR